MEDGHIFPNLPPVIETVFKYLTLHDLEICTQVCDLWRSIAETEKNRREDIFTFSSIVLRRDHRAFPSKDFRRRNIVKGELQENLSKQLEELNIKTDFCLIFVSKALMDDIEDHFPNFEFPSTSTKKLKQENGDINNTYMKAVIQTALGQYLPENCRTALFEGLGIVACHKKGSDIMTVQIKDGYGITGIMIPCVPGVKILQFPVTTGDDISKLMSADLNVKCFIVLDSSPGSFDNFTRRNNYDKVIQGFIMREDLNFAIGGSLNSSESVCGSCIAFCGEGVEAASLVIFGEESESDVEAKLKLFEDTGLLNDKCFALMFSCLSRAFCSYRKREVESSIFNRLYPKIPLLGVYGNQEIGLDHLPNLFTCYRYLSTGNFSTRSHMEIVNGYCFSGGSVFVLISLKI